MHCTEHTVKQSHVLAYHYEIIGGIRLPSFCSLTMKHCISSQIHIKVTYVIQRNSAIHLTEAKKCQCWSMSQKQGGKKREKTLKA